MTTLADIMLAGLLGAGIVLGVVGCVLLGIVSVFSWFDPNADDGLLGDVLKFGGPYALCAAAIAAALTVVVAAWAAGIAGAIVVGVGLLCRQARHDRRTAAALRG